MLRFFQSRSKKYQIYAEQTNERTIILVPFSNIISKSKPDLGALASEIALHTPVGQNVRICMSSTIPYLESFSYDQEMTISETDDRYHRIQGNQHTVRHLYVSRKINYFKRLLCKKIITATGTSALLSDLLCDDMAKVIMSFLPSERVTLETYPALSILNDNEFTVLTTLVPDFLQNATLDNYRRKQFSKTAYHALQYALLQPPALVQDALDNWNIRGKLERYYGEYHWSSSFIYSVRDIYKLNVIAHSVFSIIFMIELLLFLLPMGLLCASMGYVIMASISVILSEIIAITFVVMSIGGIGLMVNSMRTEPKSIKEMMQLMASECLPVILCMGMDSITSAQFFAFLSLSWPYIVFAASIVILYMFFVAGYHNNDFFRDLPIGRLTLNYTLDKYFSMTHCEFTEAPCYGNIQFNNRHSPLDEDEAEPYEMSFIC